MLAAAIAIGVGKYWPSVDERTWAIGSLATAIGLGASIALVWTWLWRSSMLEAAVEIDRRYGLKERVSSTLSLDDSQLQSEIGQALVRDAQRRVGQLDLTERFGMRLDWRALLPLAPAAAAFLLVLFVEARLQETTVQAASSAETAQIKKTTKALVKKIDEQRKEAEEKGLKEADGLLKQIEEQMKGLSEKSQTDRKQSLVALNELVKDAEKKRRQLASSADLKQQLKQLKNMQSGPADRVAQALKNGDLAKAIKEIDDLKKELAGDKLSPQAKQALAKQLDQLQQALEKKTQAHEEAKRELEKQIDQQRKAGNTAAADKLQQQLDKLAEKKPQMDQLAKMAQQCKQAAQSMKDGDAKQAADALLKMSEQLAGMQKDLDEMEMMDSALEEMADAKNAMACKECNGEGCAACQGKDGKLDDKWSRKDFGTGEGRASGRRPESKNDTDLYDSQVKQNVRKGGSVFAGTAGGPNRKGEVQAEIRGQFTGAEQQTAEAQRAAAPARLSRSREKVFRRPARGNRQGVVIAPAECGLPAGLAAGTARSIWQAGFGSGRTVSSSVGESRFGSLAPHVGFRECRLDQL